MRTLRMLVLALLLAVAAAGCTTEWEPTGEPVIIAGTEEEQRIMDREDRADNAATAMVLTLLVVGPLALAATAIALSHRGDA